MMHVKEPSLARQFIDTGLACIVWQMNYDDMEELKTLSTYHYDLAIGELNDER